MTNHRSQNQSMVPSSREKERKKERRERKNEYHEYIFSTCTSKRKQISIPHNRNCLDQFRENPWNQTMDVHRGSTLTTRVITRVGGGGSLFFSSYVGSGPVSTLHPQKSIRNFKQPQKILKF